MSPLLLPLLPLVAGGVVVLARARPGLQARVAVGSLLATLAVAGWAAAGQPSQTIAWSPAFALTVSVDGFRRLMVVLVPVVAAPIVAYAAATEPEGRTRLLTLLLAFVAGMLLLILAADFVTLLIAWELIGAVSWALIGHGWHERSNTLAATQAFVTTRLGDLGVYAAAGATFAASGSFRFDTVAAAPTPWREIVAGGVLLAAAAKSAQLPFSPWLFAAMAGPIPVSALLHSATLVAAGAYLLIILAPALEPVAWFLPAVALVGLVTALGGGVVAAAQDHAKRALAASTSAQYGLMFVAVGAGSTTAAAAQLVTHAAFKSLLFLAAGVAIHAAGSALLDRMRLGRALPVVAVAAAVGAAALAGLPPLGGAWSKEAILAGAFEASALLGAGALIASLLTALYAARLWLLAFGPGGNDRDVRQASSTELAALGVLAAVTVGLGALWLPAVSRGLQGIVRGELGEGAPWNLPAALAILASGTGLAVVLDRRRRLGDLGLSAPVCRTIANWLAVPRATALLADSTLRLSALLARGDDRLIDAGVRAAARIARGVSALVSRRLELSIDNLVRASAAATLQTAVASRVADDAGVDRAVEAAGRGVGVAGHQSRRLQTGHSHQYFVIVAAGLIVIAALLVVTR